jgi:hypothetical protein
MSAMWSVLPQSRWFHADHVHPRGKAFLRDAAPDWQTALTIITVHGLEETEAKLTQAQLAKLLGVT